jgi:hypothetical protein
MGADLILAVVRDVEHPFPSSDLPADFPHLSPVSARSAWQQSAQVGDCGVEPSRPRQPATICPDRALYRSKGSGCRSLDSLATGEGGRCRGVRRDGRGDFFRDHAPAFRIGGSAAGGNSGEPHGDDALSVKPHVPHFNPELPRDAHVAFIQP